MTLRRHDGRRRRLARRNGRFGQCLAIRGSARSSSRALPYRQTRFLFETGYGPPACRISARSARSRAPPWSPRLRVLTEDSIKTRLLAFSDDMDGLRKVPDNVPNKEMLAAISASR